MLKYGILVPEGALAASVGITLDILSMADRVARTLRLKRLSWRVLGSGHHARLSNGMSIDTLQLSRAPRLRDEVLILPGIGLDHPSIQRAPDINAGAGVDERYDEESLLRRMRLPDAREIADFVRRHHDEGGVACASCSGVLAIGMAGLAESRRITTHWRLASFMAKHFPGAQVETNRMVVDDRKVVTAGAAMAQMDLMLYLLRQTAGRELAELTMKYMLIDSRPTQARYMVWDHVKQDANETVQRFEQLIESSLPDIITVAHAAKRLNLTQRTLSRRLLKVTGDSPMDIIQKIRMRHAQRLLDSTDLPIEEIATRVGYTNATSLRKLTLKLTQLTPTRLRQTF